ncbi:NAD-dependent deacylase [bacterium]|nr:NAD-dependent deacylase [bacterium]
MSSDRLVIEAAEKIVTAQRVASFTGAGISVESGIPPFRGKDGLWSKYDPDLFEINHFRARPAETWNLLRDVFYVHFDKAEPNPAHKGLARLEQMGVLKTVITQNVDNLHQKAGNTDVIEFHGSSSRLICLDCNTRFDYNDILFDLLPPFCPTCRGILKPDFIFFGEGIPPEALQRAFLEANLADLFLVIGTTGEVYPAALVPVQAKQQGACIVEINPEPSSFTFQVTDIFLQGNAGPTMTALMEMIEKLYRQQTDRS